MKRRTEELLNALKNTADIEEYLEQQQENLVTCRLSEYLENLLKENSLNRSECIKLSGLDRTYCYQIFSGKKTPSRDKLLALCFSMNLSLETVQNLLKSTGYPILYPRIQRDSIILFALERKLSLADLNELLFEMDLSLIE